MAVKTTISEKAAFCASLAWPKSLGLEWFDLSGVHKIDEDRRVKVTLVTTGCAEHFVGFRVEIVSKTTGPIDKHLFLFGDYLDAKAYRDTRNNGKGSDTPMQPEQGYEVVSYCGWHWYLKAPKDTSRLCGAIAAYVRSFS